MADVLMFNPNDLAYFMIDSSDKGRLDKMKEGGFVQNPRLVAMYHDGMKKHVMVMVQSQKEWEAKGYYAEPTFIYHPTEGTMMVSAADAKKAFNNGWHASPAQFPGNDVGKLKTLTLKEAVNGN